jgi:hypothetical protein
LVDGEKRPKVLAIMEVDGSSRVRRTVAGLFGLVSLVSVLAAAGCGSSRDSAANGSTYGAAIESCSQYCEAYVAKGCSSPAYPNDGQCKISTCSPIPQMASASCYSATSSLYACLKGQSDVCGDGGCTTQATAAVDACP